MALRHELRRLTTIRELCSEIYSDELRMSEVIDTIINDLDNSEVENLIE